MTDRELLELAAKAAGIDYGGYYGTPDKSIKSGLTRNECTWNPLTDDADALRLAVDLGLIVSPGAAMIQGRQPFGQCVDEDECDDKHAATRLAIVLAAAEIGREKGNE